MDNFFGGMFDFNGDGKTDDIEQALDFAIVDEMDEEEDDGGSDVTLEFSVSVSTDDGDNEPSEELQQGLDAAEEALQLAAEVIQGQICVLENVQSDLNIEEPDDITSERWDTWHETMEKLRDVISGLEAAADGAE